MARGNLRKIIRSNLGRMEREGREYSVSTDYQTRLFHITECCFFILFWKTFLQVCNLRVNYVICALIKRDIWREGIDNKQRSSVISVKRNAAINWPKQKRKGKLARSGTSYKTSWKQWFLTIWHLISPDTLPNTFSRQHEKGKHVVDEICIKWILRPKKKNVKNCARKLKTDSPVDQAQRICRRWQIRAFLENHYLRDSMKWWISGIVEEASAFPSIKESYLRVITSGSIGRV